MATMFKTQAEAQDYASKLTLEGDGLPSTQEDPTTVGQLLQHSVQLGKDIFSVDRFVQWTSKRTNAMTQAAAGRNAFSASGPCPITEEEFGKYAPDDLACVFFTPGDMKLLEKAFPTGIGQRLRSKKKWGEPRLNDKTGEKSGGRYGSGSFGWWFGGVVAINVDVPGKGSFTVKGRPTINMALEGTKTKPGNPAIQGAGEEDEDEKEAA